MTEDQDAKDSQSDSGSKTFTNKNKDKKGKTHRPLTKIILRRLPPTMTEEAFIEQVSPIPEYDHFYFAKPDPSLGNNVYSRAYINFVNVDDIYLFRDKFDGYVFLDDKGVEYVGIVEYAPFQRIPKKKKKKDPKCGTIESDPVYQEFLDNLSKDQETESQPKLEYSYPVNESTDKKVQSTPLLEYLAARKLDKRGRDERRRRENDKRKMRIERKSKDIKRSSDLSEEENCNENYDCCGNNKQRQNIWYGKERMYNKNKNYYMHSSELDTAHGSEEMISTDSDWDSHFPALAKSHNTFTLSSNKVCSKKDLQEMSQKSGGDTQLKEEDYVDNDYKKIKSREWDKDKSTIDSNSDKIEKDGTIFESKTYKDQRKTGSNLLTDKKKRIDSEKRETGKEEESEDMGIKKDKRDKVKEIPRETKSKKYSDTRKERLKQPEPTKQSAINKIMASDGKSKLNHDDIKPFTQLPQVKTDDLTRIIEDMDRKAKLEELQSDFNKNREESSLEEFDMGQKSEISNLKMRRSSLESGEIPFKDSVLLTKQQSLEDRSKSTEREGSEEPEKSESADRRTERRIRNKNILSKYDIARDWNVPEVAIGLPPITSWALVPWVIMGVLVYLLDLRVVEILTSTPLPTPSKIIGVKDRPSLVIYQPGMGKFSKQRLAKEKDTPPTGKTVNDSEKKDT